MSEKTGLYIHIPFCVKKCNYCAFLSFDAETSPRKEYADALVNEIKLRADMIREAAAERGIDEEEALALDTVYVGGGTPSVLDISQMRDIMHAVKTSFNIKEGAEITIEANPATLGRKDGVMLAKLQAYKYMGFNRLSMGVQSMDNDRLHFLGRIHTAENVARDVELARRKGFDNINLDLIFSVPGSSTHDALTDLEKILEFRPEHISCYSLQIEEGTPFGRMAAAGELAEVPDEEDRHTYHEICRMLRNAGYEHYEISNFARMDVFSDAAPGFDAEAAPEINSGTIIVPGFAQAAYPDDTDTDCMGPDAPDKICISPYRSRHNSLYWDMSDYIGAGLGASGFVNGVRYKNISDIEKYISTFSSLQKNVRASGASPKVRQNLYGDDTSSGLRDIPCTDSSSDPNCVNSEPDFARDKIPHKEERIKTVFTLPLEEEHINTAFDNISEAVFTGLRRREGIKYSDALKAYRRGGARDPAAADGVTADISVCNPAAADGVTAGSGACDTETGNHTIKDEGCACSPAAGANEKEEFWRIFADSKKEAEDYASRGLMIISDEGIKLTEAGIDISNSIMSLFV